MTQDRSSASDGPSDATDVVEGKVGSAWLRDPATSGSIGADLEGLTPIDVPSADRTDEGGSIEGRPESPEHQAGDTRRRDR
ncbi:MAG: hypothetical protein ACYDAK_09645 [Candidatus Limnocylindrales bacterium]